MSMAKKYYIAYGSNLNIQQMWQRCPSARIIGTAELEGWQLLFKGSLTGSYLTIEQEPSGRVPVAVWEVTREDERSLDWYEGFPNFYYKKELTLSVKGIRSGIVRERPVFVYIMHEDRAFGLPTDLYFKACADGYRDFDFDTAHLLDALAYSAKEVANER